MKKKNSQFFILGMVLISLCGCNNHLQSTESETLEYKHSEKPQIVYQVKSQIQPGSSVMLQFDITEQRRTVIDTYSVRQTIDRYTPYEGWRESYEILMGIGLFPVAFCSHVLNVVSFGTFPYSLATAITDMSFAGMNPCLNIESTARFQEVPLKTVRKKIESKTEIQTTHAVNVPVEIRSSNGALRTISQHNGIALINMLDTKGFGPTIKGDREINVHVAGSATPSDTIIIERVKQRLLMQISEILQAYHAAPSGTALYNTVVKLERLQAGNLAFLLEKEEMAKNKNKSQFIKDFNNMLDKEKGKSK